MVLGIGDSVVSIIIRARDEFSAVFSRASLTLKGFQKAGLAAGVVAGGIAVAFKKAIDTTISFESAFAGVRKTANLTESEFKDLENRFKEMTKTTPETFEGLSRIGEIAGQLGVEGVDNLEKFTKVVADMSVATDLTAERASFDFARIANVMQEPLDNVDRMGSSIVELGNNFAVTEPEITSFATRIASVGKLTGMTTADILGISAAFGAVGVPAERGGTAVQKTLIKMQQAVAEGGEKLNILAQTAGLTSDEFKQAFEQDAANAFRLFVEGLGTQGENAIATLADLGIADQRIIQSLLAVAGAGDTLKNTLATSSAAFEENTALTEEAQKRYATLESQLKIVGNKFRLLGNDIGEILVPILRDFLIPFLNKLIDIWNNLSPEMKTAIVIFTVITGAVLALAAAIALITLIASPWLLIVFAIAAALGILGAGIFLLIKNFDKLKIAAAKVFNFLIQGVENWVNNSLTLINLLIKAFNKVAGFLGFKGISELSVDFSAAKFDIARLETNLANKNAEDLMSIPPQNQNINNINIENVNGLDPTEVSAALDEMLRTKINI